MARTSKTPTPKPRKPRKPVAPKVNGYILWEGPSQFDGAPVAVIVTGVSDSSTNAKTGAMLQVYILRSDMSPQTAINRGKDTAICGDCKHRKGPAGRTCYVNIGQGPRSVYAAYRRGRYPHATVDQIAHLIRGRMVRFGAYGDPAVTPVGIYQDLAAVAAGWTGYTHRWKDADFNLAAWAPLVMASVDTVLERVEAVALGMRYFRVTSGIEPLLIGETRCPASAEMGKRTTCSACALCSGTTSRAKSVIIADHSTKGRAIVRRQALAI